MIVAEIMIAKNCSHGLLTNFPILSFDPVNITKGTTAKLNCIDSMTWLKTNRSAVPFSP